MRAARHTAWVIAALVAIGGASGCSKSEMVANPGAALPANEDSAAFLDRISSGTSVSENDAMRGMLMLLDGKDAAATFKQRVEVLLDRKIADPTWDYDAARATTKGKLAYMIYQACKMTGGVVLTLTGPSQRYCLRELQYRNMMVRGSMFSPVTGMEYVAVLSRADTYVRTGTIPPSSGNLAGG